MRIILFNLQQTVYHSMRNYFRYYRLADLIISIFILIVCNLLLMVIL